VTSATHALGSCISPTIFIDDFPVVSFLSASPMLTPSPGL